MEEAIRTLEKAVAPGAFLVDTFPIRKLYDPLFPL